MSRKDPSDTSNPAASPLRGLSLTFHVLAGLDVVVAVVFASFAKILRDGTTVSELAADPGQLTKLMILFCMFMTVASAVFALLHLLTALRLRRHRSRSLCVGVSALSCLLLPFGTIAGLYALEVLRKPAIKALFTSTR